MPDAEVSQKRSRRTWIETAAVISIFLALVIGFFQDVLFGPNILVATNPYQHAPWRHYATGPDLARKPGIPDSFGAYLPRRVELSRSITAGRLPLWNPWVFAGAPFLADPQTRVLYPVCLLLVPMDPGRAMGWDVAIHVFLAMLGTYAFLRALRASAPGAVAAGIAYGLCSFMFKEIMHPSFVASAAWIPWIFWAFEVARRAERAGTLLLTLALSMGYLAGFPQILLLAAAALIVYAASLTVEALACRNPSEALRHLRVLGIAGLLSALIVAAQLLPFYEFIRNGVGLRLTLEQMKVFLSSPLGLVRALLPDFFAGYGQGAAWAALMGAKGHGATAATASYCGVPVALAALASLAFLGRSRHARAMWVVLALSVGLATSALVMTVAYAAVPFISYAQIGRIAVIICFAIAVLGGMGLSLATSPGGRRGRLIFVIIVAAALGVLAACYLTTVIARSALVDWLSRALEGTARSEIADAAGWITFQRGVFARGIAFAAASLALIAGYLWLGRRSRVLAGASAAALVAVLAVDLVAAHRDAYDRQPARGFESVPGIEVLRGMLGQPGTWRTTIAGRDTRALPVNSNQIFGISSLGGRCTIEPRSYQDISRAQADRADAKSGSKVMARRTSIGEIDHLMCARFVRADSVEDQLMSPMLSAAILRDRHLGRHLGMFGAGGLSEFAFAGPLGESLRVPVKVPTARYLDFRVATGPAPSGRGAAPMRPAGPAGPVRITLAFASDAGRAVFDTTLTPQAQERGWNDVRLDISPAQAAEAVITMYAAAAGERSAGQAAWAGLEFVEADCAVSLTPEGYRVSSPQAGTVISLHVSSTSREAPIEIRFGRSDATYRWVSFPPGMGLRRISAGLPRDGAQDILVRSDSAFTLVAAKLVSTAFPHLPEYDLVYDTDMCIYENFAAVERGVCLAKQAGQIGTEDGQRVLKIRRDGLVRDLARGRARVASYRPEEVVIETWCGQDSYLLLQDTYYPGWTASVDGAPAEVLKTDVGIRAVEVASGRHSVRLAYRPRSLWIGTAMSCLGLLLAAAYWRLGARRPASGSGGRTRTRTQTDMDNRPAM